MKAKLKGAEQGHSLLKRKSEALTKCVDDHWPTLFNLVLIIHVTDDFEVWLRTLLHDKSPETSQLSDTAQKSRGESMKPRGRWVE